MFACLSLKMKSICISKPAHVVVLMVLGTVFSLGATHWLAFYVLGLEKTDVILRAALLCPIVISPVMLFVLGRVLMNASQLRMRLQTALERDFLTDIYNRKYFYDQLAGMPIATRAAILMIDIDFFKKVNDVHGHFVGDEVIRNVAQTLAESVAYPDFVARFGGEEFVAYLQTDDIACVCALAERLRGAVEASSVATPTGQVQVTVSIGLSMTKAGVPIVSVVNEADDALLAAKRAGRNCVVLAGASQVFKEADGWGRTEGFSEISRMSPVG